MHTELRGKSHIALDKILDQIKTAQNQVDIRKEWEKNTWIICQRLLNNLWVIINVSVFADWKLQGNHTSTFKKIVLLTSSISSTLPDKMVKTSGFLISWKRGGYKLDTFSIHDFFINIQFRTVKNSTNNSNWHRLSFLSLNFIDIISLTPQTQKAVFQPRIIQKTLQNLNQKMAFASLQYCMLRYKWGALSPSRTDHEEVLP